MRLYVENDTVKASHKTEASKRAKRRITTVVLVIFVVIGLVEFGIMLDRIRIKELDMIYRDFEAEYPSRLARTTWRMEYYYVAPGIRLPADAKFGNFYIISLIPLLSFSDDGKLVGGLTQGVYKTRDDMILMENVSKTGFSNPPSSILYPHTHYHMLENVMYYHIEGSQLILRDKYGTVYIYLKTDYCDIPICLRSE